MDGAPNVGAVDGVEVALGGVDIVASGVVVRLLAVQGERTEQLDAEYRAAFDAWAEVLRRSREEAGDAPTQPGARVFTHLPVTLADDVGTVYVWAGGQSAGTGTEWLAEQRFAPAPPPMAKRITVKVGEAEHEHRLVR